VRRHSEANRSSLGSISPSRRLAASSSHLRAIRSAVPLSVVRLHLVRRRPVWSNHWTYQYPPRLFLPPRLKTAAIRHLCLSSLNSFCCESYRRLQGLARLRKSEFCG